MKSLITLLLSMIASLGLHAQIKDSLQQEAAPLSGIHQMVIKYYGIEFTEPQRNQLEGRELEFIYEINVAGKPRLLEVNGVQDSGIIDSLKRKTTKIGDFQPRIADGKAETSYYFVKFTFPDYEYLSWMEAKVAENGYREADLEDFACLKEFGRRLDLLFGGMLNQFVGRPSEYLRTGGGMKVDITYAGENRIIYGLHMNFYGNSSKLDYPIPSNRDQLSAPPTLLTGLVIGKWFNRFNIQGELNFAVQNVTERRGIDDVDWVQLNGWSPGLVLNYPIPLGAEKTLYYYGMPTLFSNHLNIHLGLRYVQLSLKEASGLMTELGLSYRMAVKGVKEYKLK